MSKQRTPIPRHVALIMDGNGRWSKARELPAIAGHRMGAEVIRQILEKAVDIGVEYLTFFAFSSENWRRPKHWIDDLMELFRYYLEQEIKELHENGVKIQIIGNRSRLDSELIQLIDYAENLTKNNNRLHVFFAISYGGRDEILKATKSISHKVLNKEIMVEDITTDLIGEYLYTKGAPDPDL
ncbi:MAG: di-trans,poly-cis-decaprenylcistransferase, partial [Proteobacteria bacterium]|nr:di-trans,poly-cis-decaprenylcistransferase [Pseudomonadota bacterium]